ncbi:MAG: hypothetical protein M8467_11610, partial [Anaerolineae bacterium]|nr:hypothetical protein [Anaerolineae bacterium]
MIWQYVNNSILKASFAKTANDGNMSLNWIGGRVMVPLVELPEIVRHYAPWFESVFSPEALVQFQRYLSGLIISE